MAKLAWWFRIVGVFYLLLTVINLYAIFVNTQFLKMDIPFPVDDAGFRITLDFWLTFVLDLLVVGAFLLRASRNPLKHLNLLWLVLWLEAIRGVADSIFLIARGYDAAFNGGFAVVHLIIIVTGFIVARQASAETSEPSRA